MIRTPILTALLCALPATALADRVPPAPTDCPRGSVGETSHAGPICAPSTCRGPSDCSGDTPACVEVALCVERQTYTPGGIGSDGTTQQRDVARGPCVDGRCPGGGECQTARRCVEFEGQRREGGDAVRSGERAEPAAAPERDVGDGAGGGCAAAPGAHGGGALALIGLALALALRKRT